MGMTSQGHCPTILLTDPSLRDQRGHHFDLAMKLANAAHAVRGRMILAVHRDFAIAMGEPPVIPMFTSTMYDGYMPRTGGTKSNGNLANTLRKIGRHLHGFIPRISQKAKLPRNRVAGENLAEELRQAIHTAGLTTTDHVLFHTADGHVYRAVVELCLEQNPDRLPNIHLATPYDMTVMPNLPRDVSVTGLITCLDLLGVLNNKVFLYAENALLADNLSTTWHAPVQPLDLPPPGRPLPLPKYDHNPLVVAYLGAARIEKGFLNLSPIIAALWESHGRHRRIRFRIQSSPQIVGYAPEIRVAIEKLRQFPSHYVELVEQEQTSVEYARMLDSADVILLPYNRERYTVRGSGIAVEAVSMGRVLITTTGTYPASLITDACGVAAANTEGYVEGLRRLTDDFPRYAVNAHINAKRYRRRYSAERYLATIMERTESLAIAHQHEKPRPPVVIIHSPNILQDEARLLRHVPKISILSRKGMWPVFLYRQLSPRKPLTTPPLVKLRCWDESHTTDLCALQIGHLPFTQDLGSEAIPLLYRRVIWAARRNNRVSSRHVGKVHLVITDEVRSLSSLRAMWPTLPIVHEYSVHDAEMPENDSKGIRSGTLIGTNIADGTQKGLPPRQRVQFGTPCRFATKGGWGQVLPAGTMDPNTASGNSTVALPVDILFCSFGADAESAIFVERVWPTLSVDGYSLRFLTTPPIAKATIPFALDANKVDLPAHLEKARIVVWPFSSVSHLVEAAAVLYPYCTILICSALHYASTARQPHISNVCVPVYLNAEREIEALRVLLSNPTSRRTVSWNTFVPLNEYHHAMQYTSAWDAILRAGRVQAGYSSTKEPCDHRFGWWRFHELETMQSGTQVNEVGKNPPLSRDHDIAIDHRDSPAKTHGPKNSQPISLIYHTLQECKAAYEVQTWSRRSGPIALRYLLSGCDHSAPLGLALNSGTREKHLQRSKAIRGQRQCRN